MDDREQASADAVLRLFESWRAGGRGYDEFLADCCRYETAGFPVLEGREAILGFVFGGGMAQVAAHYGNPRLTTIRRLDAQVLHLAASGRFVFTERIDHHYDAAGTEVLAPRLVGVMEFDDEARCVAWRDYHDPAYFTGRASPPWSGGQPLALAPAADTPGVEVRA